MHPFTHKADADCTPQQMLTVHCAPQLEKPKKQRRKPAIAEVKDEEDQDVPTAAMPAGSDDLAEQDLAETKAEDNGDEPVSGSDQEEEEESEAEAEVIMKKKRSYVRLVPTRVIIGPMTLL